jgi:hypothetical protein
MAQRDSTVDEEEAIDLTGDGGVAEVGPGNSVFREAPSRPGTRLVAALKQMREQLSGRGGAAAGIVPSVGSWLESIYLGQIHPSTLSDETLSELRFLAATLDTLLSGRLLSLGDLITQRLKATQIKIRGDAALAAEIDMTPCRSGTLTTPEEEYLATRRQLLTAKLADLRQRTSGGR